MQLRTPPNLSFSNDTYANSDQLNYYLESVFEDLKGITNVVINILPKKVSNNV